MPENLKSTRASRRSNSGLDVEVNPLTSPIALSLYEPWNWLKKGLSDVHACRYRSVLYGVCFVLMGFGIDHAHAGNNALALAVSAAFLFAGPFLSTGLYELSRQRQADEPHDLMLSLFAWCRNPDAIGHFALFLSPAMVIWLWLSVPLFGTVAHGFSMTTALLSVLWLSLALVVFMARSKPIGGSRRKYTDYRDKFDTNFVHLLFNRIRHLI
jgi:hypothetical protein